MVTEESINKFNEFLSAAALKLFLLALVAVIGCLIVRFIMMLFKKVLKKSKIEHTTKTFIFSFTKIILYFIVAITALSTIGVNVSSLLTALGAAALTAGLALQDNLKNFVSGMVILLNKPFVAGDVLEFEDLTGSVESINVFYTTLKSLDDKIVRIPNSKLTSNNVVNCTIGDKRKMFLKYTVSYEDDLLKVRKVIMELINDSELVLKDPEPAVCVGKHLDSGIEIIVKFWVNPDNYFNVYYYMQENVKLAFDNNGITIPYPHIVVKNDK